MTNITKQIIDTVSNHYQGTSKRTSSVNAILRELRDNIGSDLRSVLSSAVKSRSSRKVVNDMKSTFNRLTTLTNGDVSQVFGDLSALACEHADSLPPTIEDLMLPSKENVETMISNMIGVPKAIATLIWNGGLKLEDLARDEHQLSKVGDGVVNVVGNYGSTRARKVTSDNSFGLSPEMVDDLLPILRGKLFTSDQLGLDVLENIQPYTAGWEYTPSQLRVAHAERLINEGMSCPDVADIQGIRPQTVVNRQKKYRKAN